MLEILIAIVISGLIIINLSLIWVLYQAFLIIKSANLNDLEQYKANGRTQPPHSIPLTDNEI